MKSHLQSSRGFHSYVIRHCDNWQLDPDVSKHRSVTSFKVREVPEQKSYKGSSRTYRTLKMIASDWSETSDIICKWRSVIPNKKIVSDNWLLQPFYIERKKVHKLTERAKWSLKSGNILYGRYRPLLILRTFCQICIRHWKLSINERIQTQVFYCKDNKTFKNVLQVLLIRPSLDLTKVWKRKSGVYHDNYTSVESDIVLKNLYVFCTCPLI